MDTQHAITDPSLQDMDDAMDVDSTDDELPYPFSPPSEDVPSHGTPVVSRSGQQRQSGRSGPTDAITGQIMDNGEAGEANQDEGKSMLVEPTVVGQPQGNKRDEGKGKAINHNDRAKPKDGPRGRSTRRPKAASNQAISYILKSNVKKIGAGRSKPAVDVREFSPLPRIRKRSPDTTQDVDEDLSTRLRALAIRPRVHPPNTSSSMRTSNGWKPRMSQKAMDEAMDELHEGINAILDSIQASAELRKRKRSTPRVR